MRVITSLAWQCSLLISLAAKAYSACDCGYSVPMSTSPGIGTSQSSQQIFTEAIETDFLHVYALPNYTTSNTERIETFGWQAQAFNVSAADARGPYGKAAQVENVIVNPIRNEYDWGGDGVNGGDPGLQLWARDKNNLILTGDDLSVRTSEIAVLRDDMLYGSFRVGIKMSSTPGTCAAFFWYRNDTSELDLEFLSRQLTPENLTSPAPLNLVIQTPLSASRGFDASTTPFFKVHPLPFDPSSSYHEYRIDWLPDSVTFYADGQPLWTVTNTSVIPREPGHLILNHWSNGDEKWSGGPPERDSVVTVSYVKAYFNSSDEGRTRVFEGNCVPGVGEMCEVKEPDWEKGISPLGAGANETGRTPFVGNRTGWTEGDSDPDQKGEGSRIRMQPLLASAVLGGFLLVRLGLT
ncbi:concanavalin A-like lectin/glucanase domain-containing protein [Elsinoe ampelina]|uniref:Concanavalin A-like lectin/glucanase domain-containing protein n=1 Tax=Elsinoe ampelina TaxID=302913 RepID=A0A6A6GJ09_9PEZI|nr:concanavalin A-like lectin/glucanase domain-containing protein [Elsinoe ampelina]